MYADGAMVAHLLRLAEPHITSRNVAGDKWDSCRAIDCVRRTDRLVLMCFVVPLRVSPATKPFGYRGDPPVREYIPKRPRQYQSVDSGTGNPG